MDVAEAVFSWVCTGIAVVTVVLLPLQASDRQRLRDFQLTLNSTPRTNVALGVLLAISGILSLLLAAGLLAAGYSFVWGLLPLGAAQLFVLGFHIWVARRPFPDLDDEQLNRSS